MKRMPGHSSPKQSTGETAEPPLAIESDEWSLRPCTKNDSLPETTFAFWNDQPAPPFSKPPSAVR
jgi:hypothetical protein